jgi:hypothetical protein
MTWLTVMEYLCHRWPRICSLVVNTSRSFPHLWYITGFVTRLARRVPLVEQELLTSSEHLRSPPVFGGVRVTRSLVLYVCFVDSCLSFCTFFWSLYCLSFDKRILITSLWYLQTLLLSQFLFYFYSILQLLRQYGIYFFILFSIAVYVFIIIKLITKYSIF